MADPSLIERLPYLVFSWEHNAFWRPDKQGYTRFIEKAGRYSKDEAEAICRDADYRTYVEQKRADPETPPSEICFLAPEAASTTEDQARLIDELTAELAASTTALERSTAAAQKVLRYIRASSEIGAAGWPIVDELDALLTKLNSFGEQA